MSKSQSEEKSQYLALSPEENENQENYQKSKELEAKQTASNSTKKNTSSKLPATVWVVYWQRIGQPVGLIQVFSSLIKVKNAYPKLEPVSDHCYTDCDHKGNGIKAKKLNLS